MPHSKFLHLSLSTSPLGHWDDLKDKAVLSERSDLSLYDKV